MNKTDIDIDEIFGAAGKADSNVSTPIPSSSASKLPGGDIDLDDLFSDDAGDASVKQEQDDLLADIFSDDPRAVTRSTQASKAPSAGGRNAHEPQADADTDDEWDDLLASLDLEVT